MNESRDPRFAELDQLIAQEEAPKLAVVRLSRLERLARERERYRARLDKLRRRREQAIALRANDKQEQPTAESREEPQQKGNNE